MSQRTAEALWIRFLSGPDIDSLGLTSDEIVDAVEGAVLGKAEQAGIGTMLRYR